MPRVKISAPKNRSMRALLEGYIDTSGKTRKEIAQHMKLSEPTLRQKLRDGDSFTAAQLGRLGRYLGIPIEELRAAAIKY